MKFSREEMEAMRVTRYSFCPKMSQERFNTLVNVLRKARRESAGERMKERREVAFRFIGGCT